MKAAAAASVLLLVFMAVPPLAGAARPHAGSTCTVTCTCVAWYGTGGVLDWGHPV